MHVDTDFNQEFRIHLDVRRDLNTYTTNAVPQNYTHLPHQLAVTSLRFQKNVAVFNAPQQCSYASKHTKIMDILSFINNAFSAG